MGNLRYVPLAKIASGGMATVYVGALRGPLGFSQLVAIKRPHAHLLEDASFRKALIAEARLAARIRHAHVVDVRDIEVVGDSVQLVMDYVEGAALGQLIAAAGRAGRRLSPGVALRIAIDACAGLAAVHETTDEDGAPLGLVHRDVSPQNILVGLDGLARITDFGIAMADHASFTPTTQGALKGKLGYMAPEYIRGRRPDKRADIFAAGVVAWEALAGKRLFKGANEAEALDRMLHEDAPPLSQEAPETGGALDAVVARALAKDPGERYQNAADFAAALEEAGRRAGFFATHADVAREVRASVGELLEQRRREVRAASASLDTLPTRSDPVVEEEAATKALSLAPSVPTPSVPTSVAVTTSASIPKRYSGAVVRLALAALAGIGALGAFAVWMNKPSSTETKPEATVETRPTETSVPTKPASSVAPISSALETSPAAAPSTPAAASAPRLRASAPAPSSSPARTVAAPPTKGKTRTLPPNPYGP